MDNQLPTDVLEKLKIDANKLYWETHKVSRKRDPYCMGLTMFEVAQEPIIKVLTEYATKLLHAEQENAELKQTNTILDAASSVLNDQANEARALLEKFISRHEGGLLPDMFIYQEIKNFLDGK